MKHLSVLFTCFCLSLLFSSCSSRSNDCLPTSDLVLTARHQKEESGQSVIEGSVFNQSLSKEYKDPRVRVDFFNNSGQNISAQEFTIEKRLGKGQSEEFSFDFMAPVGADSAAWNISCAKDI